MKVVCIHDKIKKAVENSERIITRNLTLPILNNFLIKTDKNRVTIISTNLEIGIRSWFSAKVEEEGELTIPAKVFSGILANLPAVPIELTAKKEGTLKITAGNYRGELHGQNPKDFPIIPQLKKEHSLVIEAEELAASLNQVISFTAISETRPEITGILFLKEKNQEFLSLVATDSFRLAEKKIYLKNEFKKDDFSFILPQRTAAETLRLIGNGDVRLIIESNQVGFETPENEIISRLIEGSYPNYAAFIPQEFKSEITVSRDELIKTIRLVSLLSSRVNEIRLKIESAKNPTLKLGASDPDLGENSAEVPIKLQGEPMEISFNWRYLLEGLQHLHGKDATLKFTDVAKPTLIKSNEDPNYFYIVMPIRT